MGARITLAPTQVSADCCRQELRANRLDAGQYAPFLRTGRTDTSNRSSMRHQSRRRVLHRAFLVGTMCVPSDEDDRKPGIRDKGEKSARLNVCLKHHNQILSSPMQHFAVDTDYQAFLSDINQHYRSAQLKAVHAVTQQMLLFLCDLG